MGGDCVPETRSNRAGRGPTRGPPRRPLPMSGVGGLCARPCPALAIGSAMPRDGSIRLSDVEAPFLDVVCAPCGRRGRYAVAGLMAKHGDGKADRSLDRACPMREGAVAQHSRPLQGAL